jgi:hypothetical protein
MIWSSQTKRGTLPHQHSRHIRNITISLSSISITALPLVRPYLVGATSIISRTAQVGNGQHLSVDNEHRTGRHQQTRRRSKACQIDDRTPRHRTQRKARENELDGAVNQAKEAVVQVSVRDVTKYDGRGMRSS